MIMYHEQIPSGQDYNQWREPAGWSPLDDKAVEQVLPNSVYAFLAKENDRTIYIFKFNNHYNGTK